MVLIFVYLLVFNDVYGHFECDMRRDGVSLSTFFFNLFYRGVGISTT